MSRVGDTTGIVLEYSPGEVVPRAMARRGALMSDIKPENLGQKILASLKEGWCCSLSYAALCHFGITRTYAPIIIRSGIMENTCQRTGPTRMTRGNKEAWADQLTSSHIRLTRNPQLNRKTKCNLTKPNYGRLSSRIQ